MDRFSVSGLRLPGILAGRRYGDLLFLSTNERMK